MVSIGEARQQLQTQQRQATQQIKQIEATKLPTVTRRQLARATPQTQVKHKAELPKRQQALKKAKQEAVAKVKEYEEKRLKPFEKEIKKAETEQARVLKRYSERASAFARVGKEKYKSFKEQQKQIRAGGLVVSGGKIIDVSKLEEAGYKPIYSDGKLTGVSDPYTQMSVSLEHLGGHLEKQASVSGGLQRPADIQVSPFESQLSNVFQVPVSGFEKALPDYTQREKIYSTAEKVIKSISPKIKPFVGWTPLGISTLPKIQREKIEELTGPTIKRVKEFTTPDIDKAVPIIEKVKPFVGMPYQITPTQIIETTPKIKEFVVDTAPKIKKLIPSVIPYVSSYKPPIDLTIPIIKGVKPVVKKIPEKAPLVIKKVKPFVGMPYQITPTQVTKTSAVIGKSALSVTVPAVKIVLKKEKELWENIEKQLVIPAREKALPKIIEFFKEREQLFEKSPQVKQEQMFKEYIKSEGIENGDWADLIKDIKQAKTQEEKLESKAKGEMGEAELLGEETDYETQQKIMGDLKSKGFGFEETIDQITGETMLQIKTPSWFETLRPGFQEKTQKETFSSYFFRKLRGEVGLVSGDIYQRGVFKGPTYKEFFIGPKKGILTKEQGKITREAELVGKGVAVGAEVAAFAVPGIREYMFFGGTAEAALRGPKPFVKFAKEEPFEVGIAALGVGATALKGIKYLKTPIITKMPKPTPIISIEKGVLQQIKYGKTTIDKGVVAVTTTIPARKAELITRFGKIIGRKPKIIDITKAATKGAYTPTPISIIKGEIVQPAYFFTQRIGKGPASYVTVSKLAGKSVPRSLEAFNKLSKTEQYAWQQLVSAMKGKPVSLELVPKMIGKQKITQKAIVEAERLYRLNPSKFTKILEEQKSIEAAIKEATKTFKPGTSKTLQEVVTIAEKIPQPKGSEVEVFKTMAGAKDITKPFARAAGEVPVTSGITLRPPTKEIRDVFTILPSETATRARLITDVSKKTKEVPRFVDLPKTLGPADDIIKQTTQAEQITKKVSKEVPSAITTLEGVKSTMIKSTIKHPRPVIPTTPKFPTSLELAPRMVGGLGKGISEYAGPTYAPVEEVIVPVEKLPDGVAILPETRIKLDVDRVLVPKIDTGLRTEVRLDVGMRQVPVSKQVQIPKMVQVPKLITIPRAVQIPKATQIPRTIQIPKATQIPRTIQIPKATQIPRTIQIPKATPTVKTPKVPVIKPIIPFYLPSGKPVRRKRIPRRPRPRKPVFTSEIRRKEKWIAIGKFKTKKGAKAIAKRRTRRTAAASFRVKKNGKVVELKPSKLFREAKKEPGVLVQKKTKRILSLGEKKEISLIGSRAAKAKRAKSKSKKSKGGKKKK